MTPPFIAILMGSENDLDTMQSCIDTLKSLDIAFEVNVLSAHRTPQLTQQYVHSATERGAQAFIAAAGMAAHLAGAVAANTIRPVIGVPISAGSLGGLDALLSTVQMPGGMPVATTAIGKAGAKNAALLAAQILALSNAKLANKIQQQRQDKRQTIQQANDKIKEKQGM